MEKEIDSKELLYLYNKNKDLSKIRTEIKNFPIDLTILSKLDPKLVKKMDKKLGIEIAQNNRRSEILGSNNYYVAACIELALLKKIYNFICFRKLNFNLKEVIS